MYPTPFSALIFAFGAGIVAYRLFASRFDQAAEASYADWYIILMLQNGHYVDSGI